MDIAAELQKIYDSEINVEILISWLWDGGIEVRLGDRLNGFLAETNVPLVADTLSLVARGHRSFLPGFDLCQGFSDGGQGTGAAPDLRCT